MLPTDCEDRPHPTRLVPHYGQAAVADSRWPRWDLECAIARLLLAGNSASLFGLRRIGKSSLIVGIECALRECGATPLTLELQGSNRIEHLVRKLVDACERDKATTLAERIRKTYADAGLGMPKGVRALFRLASGGGGDGEREQLADPTAALEYLEVALGPLAEALKQNEQRIVLILDELPFFCQDLQGQGGAQQRHISTFLAELRRWRREGLTMLVCGSIGVHRLERGLGVDPNLLADLKSEQLPPLSDAHASALVDALAEGCGFGFWGPDHRQAVLAAPPAAYPTFFQQIFIELQRAARARAPTPAETGTIAAAATDALLEKNFFPQFDHRLDYYESAQAECAMRLFRRLAADTEGAGVPARDLGGEFPSDWPLVRKTALVTALIQDDFIRKLPGNRLAFATPLVAAWWAERGAWGG
jgi:hypothetical protein